jgi:hypothetical protein
MNGAVRWPSVKTATNAFTRYPLPGAVTITGLGDQANYVQTSTSVTMVARVANLVLKVLTYDTDQGGVPRDETLIRAMISNLSSPTRVPVKP